MGTSPIRILLVDDYEPFRRFLYSTLQSRADLQIIGEASDGLEGVQKAAELQPDLVLLDIGLPKLNGIEVARRIRNLSSQSRILFLSQGSSAAVVQEVFSIGAKGYVVKTDAGRELLTAVDAVVRGETFISSGVAKYGLTTTSHEKSLKTFNRDTLVARHQLPTLEISRRHEVQFYSHDALFLDGFTQFIGATLKAGNAVIVVATESHREALIPRLQAHGSDIAVAIDQGRYLSLDAAETLSTFIVNNLPDPERFLKVTGDLIMSAAKAAKGEHARVAACGECAPLLWAQGHTEAAIQLERLWNKIIKSYEVDILCGYPLGSFQGGAGSDIFEKICAEHSAVHSL